MEYRELGKTGLKASIISAGCEGILGKSEEEMVADLNDIMDRGVNLIEMYTPDPAFHKAVGRAIRGRKNIILQAHIGSVWKNGEYLRTRDMDLIRSGFPQRLEQLGVDSVEIGMIHFSDSEADWDVVMKNLMPYASELKKEGLIHHIGVSTHSATTAIAAAKSGLVDVILFSINPCYDMQPGEKEIEALMDGNSYKDRMSTAPDRQRTEFYELCERSGIGIDVMKAFGGGDILSEKLSPFGKAFTPIQCLHYALTRPAVASVCVGCKTKEEWEQAFAYLDATDEEKDYSDVLAGAGTYSVEGHCMYCGHCAPCTVGIRIADATKYLNLAVAEGAMDGGSVPETVAGHYHLLEHHASECIECGACESRCPFNVGIIANMKKAAELFGE